MFKVRVLLRVVPPSGMTRMSEMLVDLSLSNAVYTGGLGACSVLPGADVAGA